MKALVYDKTLFLDHDFHLPMQKNESLVKILMSGICNTDLEIVKGYMNFQGILGHEFVGVVVESSDKNLINQRVVGEINCACHQCEFCKKNLPTHCPNRSVLGISNRNGIFAEYTYLPNENLHIIPDNITNREAVFVEPIAAAFQITEQIKIQASDNIIILGDGKLGLIIAKVLKLFSNNIILVGKHKNKLQLVQDDNIPTILLNTTTIPPADIVIDATGSISGLELALQLIKPKGTIVLKTTVSNKFQINLAPVVINEIQIIGSRCGPFKPAIEALKNKKIDVLPLISNEYTLDNILEAFEKAKKNTNIKILLQH